jgi:creatinine amidohydrolase/Fe(II)-dependent formamide hydrolase-like protein
VGALDLYTMTWPEIRHELDAGRDTIVIAFGAVEQHGHHMPMGTDSMLGEALSEAIAERLDAFRGPTMRVGCSQHHMAFPGTMTLSNETFNAMVADIVRGWAGHGFKRIVLLPTHGGNFGPLGEAVGKIDVPEGVQVIAISDLGLLVNATLVTGSELGVSAEDGGIHGGEWETSMMLDLHPELVHMDRAVAGYKGELQSGLERFLAEGVHAITDTGVFGDPANASAEHGRIYFERFVEIAVEEIEGQSAPAG